MYVLNFRRNARFAKAAAAIGEDELMVVGGPASIEMIDREGHLITTIALTKAKSTNKGRNYKIKSYPNKIINFMLLRT